MMTSSQNRFRRFFSGAARSISIATQADRLAHTPEDVFIARGTTREKAIRDLIDQL
ncbi:hypothetical protein [Hoeflea olei]|uniref:hypothetical protein n=1 Tax=Hoeflea olei TaxID=1480615 RepID=UPI0014959F45|nr:hypothetical protein [Hoeflea olei]